MPKEKSFLISLWPLWILMSTLSYSIGIAFSMAATQNQRSAGIQLILMGFAISGLLNSTGQWLLVKNNTGSLSYFSAIDLVLPVLLTIAALCLNIPVSHLGDSQYNDLYPLWSIILPIIIGVTTGIFQWLFMFKEISGSFWWIPITTLSFIVSMNISFFIFVFLLDVEMWGGNWFISGAVQGAMYGVFVGILTCMPMAKMLFRSNNKRAG